MEYIYFLVVFIFPYIKFFFYDINVYRISLTCSATSGNWRNRKENGAKCTVNPLGIGSFTQSEHFVTNVNIWSQLDVNFTSFLSCN